MTSARRASRQRGMNVLQRRLDSARLDAGLTYEELAAAAGMTVDAAYYLIAKRMRRMPKHDRLVGMAKALPDVELAELQRLAGDVFGINVYDRRGPKFEIHVASSRKLDERELGAVESLVEALAALLDDQRK